MGHKSSTTRKGKMAIHILVIFLSLGLASCTTCPSLFQEIGGCCYHFSESIATWNDAKAACQELGTLLEKEVGLAEVGTVDACNDVLLMNTVGISGNSYHWFGAQ